MILVGPCHIYFCYQGVNLQTAVVFLQASLPRRFYRFSLTGKRTKNMYDLCTTQLLFHECCLEQECPFH